MVAIKINHWDITLKVEKLTCTHFHEIIYVIHFPCEANFSDQFFEFHIFANFAKFANNFQIKIRENFCRKNLYTQTFIPLRYIEK